MNLEAKEAISQSLFTLGYREAYGPGKGWFKTIEANGPPGLTSAEQEINRRGGVAYGKDAVSILKAEFSEIRRCVAIGDGYDEPWMKDWLEDAEKALTLTETR